MNVRLYLDYFYALCRELHLNIKGNLTNFHFQEPLTFKNGFPNDIEVMPMVDSAAMPVKSSISSNEMNSFTHNTNVNEG